MGVDTQHAQYAEACPRWKRCRDAVAGMDKIKEASTEYLPMLPGGDASLYDAFLRRSYFYPATDRTIDGMIGAAFRLPPTLNDMPEAIKAHLLDITLEDSPFETFAAQALREMLTTGRYGVLIDVPAEPSGEGRNRPYWVGWSAENIVNWRVRTRRDGKRELVLVVLKETIEKVDPADPFVVEPVVRYKVLKLGEEGRDDAGLYVMDIWEEANDDWVVTQTIRPTRSGGQRLDFIPFAFISPTGVSENVAKPPLLDLVDTNLIHYTAMADLQHGRHTTAFPTPWVTGQEVQGPLVVGAGGWNFPAPEAKCGMLEFEGKGLESLENADKEFRVMMATLGARLLESMPARGEAAETVRMRQSGDIASLDSIVRSESYALTQLFRWHAWWAGVNDVDTLSVELNRDFFDKKATPEELKAIVLAWQSDLISQETAYFLLQQGEMTRPTVLFKEEKALIDAQALEAQALLPEPGDEDEPVIEDDDEEDAA